MARTPSPYQQAVLDWIVNGNGNAIINAVAGGGKSSTLEMAADVLPANTVAAFLAFNKPIAEELKKRLPAHMDVRTFHSLASNAVKRYAESKLRKRLDWKYWTQTNKVHGIFDDVYGRDHEPLRAPTLKLVALMKAHAMLPDTATSDLEALADHFGIESEDVSVTLDDIITASRAILTRNNEILDTVDFDDHLYFAVIFNVTLPTFDFVMIDESQDTNMVQRILVRRIMRPGARLIAVGDEHQAIYGFRGASSDAMSLIRSEFECVTLPLSISYRCPASVVRLAQNFVPHIMPRDNAPKGSVNYPTSWKLRDFTPTDLVVCRNTAPLVQMAYRMISRQIPVKIMGRDIGKGLTTLITKLAGKRGTLETLPEKIASYQEREVSAAMAKRQESKAQSIADKCESIMALIDAMSEDERREGVQGLLRLIDGMFSDKREHMTTLATVHKSKGMEAQNVFILDSDLMPSKYARQAWQQQQEANLQYVAITRALDTLTFISSKSLS